MNNIFYEASVIWAQIDANQHMRHSAYADVAAQARMSLLDALNLKPALFQQYMIGPILFREELIYLKEVNLNEKISVSCEMAKCKSDGSKWSIRHQIYKSDGQIAAIVNVDGAWIDLKKRKVASLPPVILESFMKVPRAEDYLEE